MTAGLSPARNVEGARAPDVEGMAQGAALIKARRFDEAITLLRARIARAPSDAELHYLLGVAAYRSQRHAEALPAFEHAVEADPGHIDALVGVGQAAKALGRWETAKGAFTLALASDPRNDTARRGLVDIAEHDQARTSVIPPLVAGPAGAGAAVEGSSEEPAHLSLAERLDQRGQPPPDPDELAGELVWSGHPAGRSVIGAVIVSVIGAFLIPRLLYGLTSALPHGAARAMLAALWRLVAAAAWPAALILVVVVLARVATSRYVVRTHRVETYTGLVNRAQVTLWLHDLERPVTIRQNLWSVALGLGAIELDSTMLRPPRGRRGTGRPGRMLLSGMPIREAERVAAAIRARSLWERRRMVQNFVSSR